MWYSAKQTQGIESDHSRIKNVDNDVLSFNPTTILPTNDLLKSIYKIVYGIEYDDIPINPDYEEITFRNVGFIGWPNVGKSSIINSIQTLDNIYLDENQHDNEDVD